MTKKKPKPSPIEDAIGDRAKKKEPIKLVPTSAELIPQNPSEIADEPSPSEILTLEELNRRTEAKLQEKWPEPEQKMTYDPTTKKATIETPEIPVSKPDPQPVTKTSSPESPPEEIEVDNHEKHVEVFNKTAKKLGIQMTSKANSPQKIFEDDETDKIVKEHLNSQNLNSNKPPAEDVELTALKNYILEDGFVLSTVAFHIVSLCAEPLTTPSTTTWDFAERAEIPAMVLTLLNQPGYLDGIWPSLRIVMGSNKGNAAWTAGISTTIAFFDVIRTLPALKELTNDS